MAKIMVVQGIAGISVYINDYRVAGSKPLGGGTTLMDTKCSDKVILDQLDIKKKEDICRSCGFPESKCYCR